MSDYKPKPNWPLRLYVIGVFLLIVVGAFVGFVKLAAWWRVAFGSC